MPFMPFLPLTLLWRRLQPAAPSLLLSLLSLSLTPPAAAQPADGAPIDLAFSSFFRQPAGPRGLEMTPALRAADGHDVRIVGYMVAQEQPLPGRFLLTPRPVRMSEHADGDADDLPPATVSVLLDASQQGHIVQHRPGLLVLTGRLLVGRDEDAATGRVSWVRLQLPREAMADEPIRTNTANDGTPAGPANNDTTTATPPR